MLGRSSLLSGVTEFGSLSAAAKQLQSNQTTIGRHISALEASLDVRLFQRTSTGLILTAEGARLLEQAKEVRSSFEKIAKSCSGEQEKPQGTVRIAVPEGLGNDLVVPRLLSFYREYPQMRLILQVSSRAANLTRGEADVALRLFRPEESNLVVRHVGMLELDLVASSEYLKMHGTPQTVDDLKNHYVIANGDELSGLPENEWLLKRSLPDRILLKSDSTATRRVATETGLGISILPRISVELSLKLVKILQRVTLPARPVWLVYHHDLRDIHRVRLVCDFLASLFPENGQFAGSDG